MADPAQSDEEKLLDECDTLVAAASPGPWLVKKTTNDFGMRRITRFSLVATDTDSIDWKEGDYEFAARARELMPDLARELRMALRREAVLTAALACEGCVHIYCDEHDPKPDTDRAAAPTTLVCGACGDGRHADCSCWCFCSCPGNFRGSLSEYLRSNGWSLLETAPKYEIWCTDDAGEGDEVLVPTDPAAPDYQQLLAQAMNEAAQALRKNAAPGDERK